MSEDQETRSRRLSERTNAEVEVLSEVAKPFGLDVVTARHRDGLMGDPDSPNYHPGVGKERRYALVGPGSQQGEIKVLGWHKRRPGTQAELRKYFLTQLASCQVRVREAQERNRIEKAKQSYDSALVAKHHGLIAKFLEIAQHKVSMVDDYGDENWEALDEDEELARCAQKIAKGEGDRGGQKVKGAWTRSVYTLRLPTGEKSALAKIR